MTSVEYLIQLANRFSSTQREKQWLLEAINAWLDSTSSPAPIQVMSVLGACKGRCESGRLRTLVTSCDPGPPVELALTVPAESASTILRMRERVRWTEPAAH